MTPEQWMPAGACRTSREDFHSDEPSRQAKAKAVCHRCPVLTPCLAWAIDTREKYGVLGGMTPPERGRYQRGLRVVVKPGPRPNNIVELSTINGSGNRVASSGR